MRTIKLKLLTQEEVVAVPTDAVTLGDFKKEEIVKNLGIEWESVKVIDRASKTMFELDEAVLPSVDSIMFITPTKTKSGRGLSYNEAKARVKQLIADGAISSINWAGKTTEDLNKIVDENSEEDLVVEEISASEVSSAMLVNEIKFLLKKVSKKVKKLSKVSGSDTSELTKELKGFKENLVDFVTKDELTREAEDLARRI